MSTVALGRDGEKNKDAGLAARGIDRPTRSEPVRSSSVQSAPVQATPTRTLAQWKSNANEIPYDTLLRSADQRKGKLVYFRGKVGYVAGTAKVPEIKVRVKHRGRRLGWYRDSEVLVYYRNPVYRVFEGDIIEFVGIVDGYYPYNPIPAVLSISLEIDQD